jgi:hypothetical protein
MKNMLIIGLWFGLVTGLVSCSDNNAAEVTIKSETSKNAKKNTVPVKTDGPAIGAIETEDFVLKLHSAFVYEPKGSDVLTGMKPKAGHKFIYLDVSLKNKGTEKLEGGFLFIALRVTDEKGKEFKKPAAGLAAYTSEQPGKYNDDEYAALWESFQPGEFHREVVYAVEVPVAANNFVLHLPVDKQRKEWKTIPFSL